MLLKMTPLFNINFWLTYYYFLLRANRGNRFHRGQCGNSGIPAGKTKYRSCNRCAMFSNSSCFAGRVNPTLLKTEL